MIEPWNNEAILPPPMNTFLYKNKKDIRGLRNYINNIIQVLSQQSPLHQESAVFSRFLYKFDKKFRNDIGYRNFKKVNTALKKYLTLNLLKDIQRFSSILPNNDEEELYLPTRQMLQYVLVRIMSFAKLMLRIVICAKQAAVFYLDRIKQGESHWMSFMPYALLSRIWLMTQVLLQHSCNWYNQLHPTLKLLQLKGLDFLPAKYELPVDLETWCDLKNLNDYSNFIWTNKIKIKMDPIMLEESDGNLCDNIFEYVSEINKNIDNSVKMCDDNITKYPSLHTQDKIQINDINTYLKRSDLGVPISRNIVTNNEKMLSCKNSNEIEAVTKSNCISRHREEISKETINTHFIDNVSNSNSLKKFLDIEEEYRNEDKNKALTGHLSLMQWHALKASLLNLTEGCSLPRKLQKKVNKIWTEKCLFYK